MIEIPNDKVIVNSFSGGRTSAFMTKKIIDEFSKTHRIINLFSNTGQEDEFTLKFINDCDINFGFNTVWLESVVHHGVRKGNTHEIVTYETATRNGSLFENMIQKHGIPNMAFPHCTRELKLAPIRSYLKSIGIKKKDRLMAIGIRIDETRRVNKKAVKENIIYPLIDFFPCDKEDILSWWEDQKFNLELPEHLGNCVWCWKKSLNKHMHVIHDRPDAFNFPDLMEMLYPYVGAHKDKSKKRTFFRGNTSSKELIRSYESLNGILPRITKDNGVCSESCEMFQMEFFDSDKKRKRNGK